jgi:hypothetical protein
MKRAWQILAHRKMIYYASSPSAEGLPLTTNNYKHMKRACKIYCKQEDDYKRVPYDTLINKQL